MPSDDLSETAYVVRYIELTNRSKKLPWSLRQFAVYHKSAPHETNFCSNWILVSASQRTEEYFNQYASNYQSSHQSSPFELHVPFISVAISSWRPYIAYLVEQVAELVIDSVSMLGLALTMVQSEKAVLTKVDAQDAMWGFNTVEIKDHQRLKEIEDRASDAALCLESTLDTVCTLTDMYHKYFHVSTSTQALEVPHHGEAYECDAIMFALREKQKEVSYTQKKVEALLAKTRATRALVR
jgi:hypothetical protein